MTYLGENILQGMRKNLLSRAEDAFLLRYHSRGTTTGVVPLLSSDPCERRSYWTLTSSTKKADGSEESVVTVNCTRTVCPA